MGPPVTGKRIQMEDAGLQSAGQRLTEMRAQFPGNREFDVVTAKKDRPGSQQTEPGIRRKVPVNQVHELMVLMDTGTDSIRTSILASFSSRNQDLIQQTKQKREKRIAIQLKKDKEQAEARIRWEKQQKAAAEAEAAAAAAAAAYQSDEPSDDSEPEARVEQKENRRKFSQKEKHRPDKQVIPPKKLNKVNPVTGFEPRGHCNRIQDKPSPTKLNKVLGQDVILKAKSQFRIPKKDPSKRRDLLTFSEGQSASHYQIPSDPNAPPPAPPDCPSHMDRELGQVYDPLADILGPAQPVVKKKAQRVIREDVCRSPPRTQNPVNQTDDQMDVDSTDNQSLDKQADDDGTDSQLLDELLGQDNDSQELRLHPVSSEEQPETGDVSEGDKPDSSTNDNLPDTETREEDDPLDEEEEELEPMAVGQESFSYTSDQELDYGADDDDDNDDNDEDREDGEADDDDDDGNFKRGRSSSGPAPVARAAEAAAPGLLALAQNTSAVRSASTSFIPAVRSAPAFAPSTIKPPAGRKHVTHDAEETEVDPEVLARRAARFSELKEVYKNQANKKVVIPTESPAPVPAAVPHAPHVPKGLSSKIALLKDPPPRSFSPDHDVEPDYQPVVREKIRKRAQIVNPDAIVDPAQDLADLFAPPVRVSQAANDSLSDSSESQSEFSPPALIVPEEEDENQPHSPVPDTLTDLTPCTASDAPVVSPEPSVTITPDPHVALSLEEQNLPDTSAEPPVAQTVPEVAVTATPAPRPVDPRLNNHRDTRSPQITPEIQVISHIVANESLPSVVKTALAEAAVMREVARNSRPVDDRFDEILNQKRKFISRPAEKTKVRFRSIHDDRPLIEIPFNPIPGAVIPDPRVLIHPIPADDDDWDDDRLPLFDEADDEIEDEAPEAEMAVDSKKEEAVAQTKAQKRPADDVFKMPVGPAPKKKRISDSGTRPRPTSGPESRRGQAEVRIIRPASLRRKGSGGPKVQVELLVNEITDIRKTLKPMKTMMERMMEAAAKEDEADDLLLASSGAADAAAGSGDKPAIRSTGKIIRQIINDIPISASTASTDGPKKKYIRVIRRKKKKRLPQPAVQSLADEMPVPPVPSSSPEQQPQPDSTVS